MDATFKHRMNERLMINKCKTLDPDSLITHYVSLLGLPTFHFSSPEKKKLKKFSSASSTRDWGWGKGIKIGTQWLGPNILFLKSPANCS